MGRGESEGTALVDGWELAMFVWRERERGKGAEGEGWAMREWMGKLRREGWNGEGGYGLPAKRVYDPDAPMTVGSSRSERRL